MRILALDVGDVRTGIAVCDELEIGAYPLATLKRLGSLKRDVAAVQQIVAEQEVDAVVVGIPTSLDGSEGPQAKKVRVFANALKKAIAVPVIPWDESLTSVEAEERMVAMDFSREKRRAVRDQYAAVILLESYLEYRKIMNARRDTETHPQERL
jgi:putative Holliday junction resolvase